MNFVLHIIFKQTRDSCTCTCHAPAHFRLNPCTIETHTHKKPFKYRRLHFCIFRSIFVSGDFLLTPGQIRASIQKRRDATHRGWSDATAQWSISYVHRTHTSDHRSYSNSPHNAAQVNGGHLLFNANVASGNPSAIILCKMHCCEKISSDSPRRV